MIAVRSRVDGRACADGRSAEWSEVHALTQFVDSMPSQPFDAAWKEGQLAEQSLAGSAHPPLRIAEVYARVSLWEW
jgi:hypothetical protein